MYDVLMGIGLYWDGDSFMLGWGFVYKLGGGFVYVGMWICLHWDEDLFTLEWGFLISDGISIIDLN